MIQVIIGNIIALIGSLLMVYSGLIKKKKKIIYVQTVQMIMFVISNIILGGITGIITNIFGCIRNILCYKNKLKNREKLILAIVISGFSLFFNNLGFIGLLPVISTVTYTLLIGQKDVIKLKILIVSTTFLWFFYDIHIQSYTSALFDFMTITTNTISIYKLHSSKNTYKII